MKDRKPIDSYVQANPKRFDIIEKSPKCLSNVRSVGGLGFEGYDKRGELFPERDASTFYDSNKEITMKKLQIGTLPWNRMSSSYTEKDEDYYTGEWYTLQTWLLRGGR